MTRRPGVVEDIFDNLRRLFQVINELSRKAERETGLTGPQLWAVKVVSESAPVSISEIARRMYLHPATVGGILDRLEAQGLVVRTRSPRDRRVVLVDLTQKGRSLLSATPVLAQDLLVAGLEGLPPAKLRHIAEGFQDMAQIIGAQGIPPRLMLAPEMVNRR